MKREHFRVVPAPDAVPSGGRRGRRHPRKCCCFHYEIPCRKKLAYIPEPTYNRTGEGHPRTMGGCVPASRCRSERHGTSNFGTFHPFCCRGRAMGRATRPYGGGKLAD